MTGFKERLECEEPIICAEGYIYELQRRGFCQAGAFVPNVVLERPHLVEALHEEYAHAGSDILVACQYFANKHKMGLINLVDQFEALNRKALEMCRRVASNTNTYAAGNLCNSVEYQGSNDGEAIQRVQEMFREQVLWAEEVGVDLFICETFKDYGEASLALKTVKELAPGVPCVVTLAPYYGAWTRDEVLLSEALQRLHNEGAAVVGLNCARGPETMLESLTDIRKTYKGPLAAVPLPLRTRPSEPTWLTLKDPKTGKLAYPDDMDTVGCSCEEIGNFGKAASDLGVKYLGLCCGNSARWTRALAESLDHDCPASRFKSVHIDKLSGFDKYLNQQCGTAENSSGKA